MMKSGEQGHMPINSTTAAKVNQVNHEPKDVKKPEIQQISMKEVSIVASGILVTGAVIGGIWWYSAQEEANASKLPSSNENVSNTGKTTEVTPQPIPAKPTMEANAAPVVSTPELVPAPFKPESMHADLYFDFGKTRLKADATTVLQDYAQTIKKGGQWVVLVQGYTDQYGPAEYNKQLALKRGDAVKQFLVELGIPTSSIKVVSLGKDAVICEEETKDCQRLNRRVHLEFIKMGPTAAATTSAIQPHQIVPFITVSDEKTPKSTELADPTPLISTQEEKSTTEGSNPSAQ